MANQMTGRVYGISPIQTIQTKSGQPFVKREIILDVTRFDPYTGERDKYENFPMFEFMGDKCKELDACKVGDVVTISFDLQGSFFDGEDCKKRNFTRVRGYKLEVKGKAVQNTKQAPQPQPQAAPMPSTPPPPTTSDLPW